MVGVILSIVSFSTVLHQIEPFLEAIDDLLGAESVRVVILVDPYLVDELGLEDRAPLPLFAQFNPQTFVGIFEFLDQRESSTFLESPLLLGDCIEPNEVVFVLVVILLCIENLRYFSGSIFISEIGIFIRVKIS